MAENNENLPAAATYLLGPITGLYFLATEKDDDFIRFHAWQSTITFGVLFVFHMLLSSFFVFSGFFRFQIINLIQLAEVILWVFLMYKAYSGERYHLPTIGELAENQLRK